MVDGIKPCFAYFISGISNWVPSLGVRAARRGVDGREDAIKTRITARAIAQICRRILTVEG